MTRYWKMQSRLQSITLTWTFIIVCVSAASFREEPSSTQVHTGESVTLRCAISGSLEGVSVFWWNINASRSVSAGRRIVPAYLSQDQINRYSITGDSSAGEFHLHINEASLKDTATYSCRIWDGTLWHFSHQVDLVVVRASPECTMQPYQPVNIGDTVRLRCQSYSTNPNVQLHWLSGGRLVQNIPNLSSGTTSIIQHVLTEQDYDVPFMCLETTTDQRNACQIVPLHRQIPVIVQDRLTTVLDGDTATFHCTTGYAKTSLAYSWFVNGVLKQETTEYLRITVGIADNGTRVTCQVQDGTSAGLSGENDAMLIVLPRPSTTPFNPTKNGTEPGTTVDTRVSTGLTSTLNGINPKIESSTSRMITKSKPGSKAKPLGGTNRPRETTETETVPPVSVEEIERAIAGGSGKSSPSSDNNFMTAFVVGSLLVGMLLVVLIVLLILFLARQAGQRQSDAMDSSDEKSGSNGENVPLGAVTTEDSMDCNAAGFVHTSPKQMKDKQGGVKETNVDYAVLDPTIVDDDSLSDFRISNEVLAVNGESQEPKTRKERAYRTYSSSTRDSATSSISAYAISNVTTSTIISSTPPPPAPSARPSQRSVSCSSLQRPLPAEPKSPISKSTQKRYTYMTPLELNSEPNERTNLVGTSPPVSPRILEAQRTSCMTSLSEEDYAEINDMTQRSSSNQPHQTTTELSRLKSASEMSSGSTPSVGSQGDSALGSVSSTEALAMDECPYATIGDEQAQNRQRRQVPPTPPSSPNTDKQDDCVIVSIEDIQEPQNGKPSHHSHKSKTPVYAKVDKSKKKKKSNTPKIDSKSTKDKEVKTPSWQTWLESVIANGSVDKHKEKNVKGAGDQQMAPAYATVWPQEQPIATNAS